MSFPNKKKSWFTETNDGWKDLGTDNPRYELENGKTVKVVYIHNFCGDSLRIGKDESGIFKYCPTCLIKVELLTAKGGER